MSRTIHPLDYPKTEAVNTIHMHFGGMPLETLSILTSFGSLCFTFKHCHIGTMTHSIMLTKGKVSYYRIMQKTRKQKNIRSSGSRFLYS